MYSRYKSEIITKNWRNQNEQNAKMQMSIN